MIYSIYNTLTGKITKIVSTNDIDAQLSENESYLEGPSNDSTQYVDNGILVNIPTKPGQYYSFDWINKTWIQNYDQAKNNVLAQRRDLLVNSDWTQTLNVPFSQEKQQEWATYRQQLRDITLQPGYPYNVDWPTPPEN
jgi:hypothetical protein